MDEGSPEGATRVTMTDGRVRGHGVAGENAMMKTNVAAVVALALGSASIGACSLGQTTGAGFSPGPAGFGGGSSGTPIEGRFEPVFGSVVKQTNPPPPISGGTLLVTHDGHTVVAADPDRDMVYVMDVSVPDLLFTVALQAGDEPGRLAEDGAGRVHVALRGGGGLVTIDPASGTILARRPVCPAPRGVAWDSTQDVVYVACATGELVTLPSAGGAATSSVMVERDLRDVLVQNGTVFVSTFRAAEVLKVGSDGSVVQRTTLPQGPSVPHVAWRTFLDAAGQIVVLHQDQSAQPISTHQPGAYGGGGAPTAVGSQVDVLGLDGSPLQGFEVPQAALPVDRPSLPTERTCSSPRRATRSRRGSSPSRTSRSARPALRASRRSAFRPGKSSPWRSTRPARGSRRRANRPPSGCSRPGAPT